MVSGKTLVVTGASGGIGSAIARAFADEGANVGIHYHSNRDGANAVSEQIEGAGGEAVVVQGDVADPEDAAAIATAVTDRFGAIDILVNNAGIADRTPWEELTLEAWNRLLGVNLGGVFNMSKAIVPGMADRGDGVVINVSSTWSLQGGTDLASYTASKGGINALTRQMCKTWSPDGVRVNTITPGPIDVETHRDRRRATEPPELLQKIIPLGRYGDPEEVAQTALFLASDGAGFINGANIVVDGGLTSTSCR